jgi:hypothetical protein
MAHSATATRLPDEAPPLADRRAALRARITYRLQVRCGGDELTAFTTDVSASGAFLETTRAFEVGAVVQLSFTVTARGEREAVEAEALVVRHVAVDAARRAGGLPGLGVAFTRFLWGGDAFAAALAEQLQVDVATPHVRRRNARATVGIPVWWGHGGQHRQAGVLTNLSVAGGFFIESQAAATRGAQLNLWFEVPVDGHARPVKAVARVVRVVGREAAGATCGMAVALEISPFDHRTLAAFLARRLAAPAVAVRRLEETHPTRLDELFAAAAAEWEAKGVEAAAATAEEAAAATAALASASGAPPAPPANTPRALPVRRQPEEPAPVRWRLVARAALKGSGALALALFALFLAAVLQLV